MGMTPDDFYEGILTSNLWDFQEQPTNLARAFNAAVACSHYLDHYYRYNERHCPDLVSGYGSFGGFVEKVREQCPDLSELRDVANALKHLYSARASAVVGSGGSLYIRTEEREAVAEAFLAGLPLGEEG